MDDKVISAMVSIAMAVIGLSIIAVLVSNGSQTASVLGATGNLLSKSITCAVSPITGQQSCGATSSSTINFGGLA